MVFCCVSTLLEILVARWPDTAVLLLRVSTLLEILERGQEAAFKAELEFQPFLRF